MKYNIFTLKGGIYCQHKWVRVLYRLESNTEPSNNLKNYKKTKTIPAKYNRNPRGSKKLLRQQEDKKEKGNSQFNKRYGNSIIYNKNGLSKKLYH